jgi:hypothetical protein
VDLIQSFFNVRLGKLAKGFFLQAQVSSASSSSIPFPQHDPPTHKCFFCSLALGHVGEYFRVTRILAPFSPTPMFFDNTLALTTLHLELNGYFLAFFEDYELDQDFKFSSDSFKLAFQCMLHLLTSGPFGMFLNTFRTIFTLKI